ncbi:MAG: C40 family peptidase [Gemmatimonadaceae bacterium]
MKLLPLALPLGATLAASSPAVLHAQAPIVRGSLGPFSVTATVEGGGLRVRADAARRTPASTRGARDVRAVSVLAMADRYVGTKYVYGGTSPRGFDCSGFVQYVFAQHGVKLPRTSRQQAGAGERLSRSVSTLRPGDLMLFATDGSRVDHVAIYAGKNRIIHSSSSGRGVRYDDLSSSRGRWFVSKHVASRRVIGDGRDLVRELEAALLDSVPLDGPDEAPRP